MECKNNQFIKGQSMSKRLRVILKSLKFCILGNKGKGCSEIIVQQNDNTLHDSQYSCQIRKEDKFTHLANTPEVEIGQIFEMIVHEMQCQRLELRQMLSSLKEKQLQIKFLKEREGWCKNCLNQVKLPALDTFSIQLDDDKTVISQAQGKSLQKWRHRILEMDDWDKIQEQIKFLEIVKDGWQSEDPPFDKHNIYELYALQAQTKDYCLPKKNWRDKLRRDRRCNKDYWIDKEKAAYAELNAIKKKLEWIGITINQIKEKIATMTTTEFAIKSENLLKDNIVNTRASQQESISRDKERQSKIEILSDPFRNISNNTQILGTPQYAAGPSTVVEDIGVTNTEDTVAPLLKEQSEEPLITIPEESETTGPQEERNKNICPDECTCKVIRALYLIVDEMKKVDTVISEVKRRDEYVYIPTTEDKNIFINSIKQNSQVCHVIINELKTQRIQINKMLKLYNESTVKFSRLDAAMEQQSDKVREMEVEVARILETVETLQKEREERHALFVKKRAENKIKDERDEELLQMDLAWLSNLEERRERELKEEEERDKDQELKRIKDRAMLTAAIRQLQELTVAQRTRSFRKENLVTLTHNPANEITCKNRHCLHSSHYNKSTIPLPLGTIRRCHCLGVSPIGLKINTADPTFIPIVYGSPVKMSRTHLIKIRGDEYPTLRQKTVEYQMQSNGTFATDHGVQNNCQQGPLKRTQGAFSKKEKHCKDIKTVNKNQSNIGHVRPWFGHRKKNYV